MSDDKKEYPRPSLTADNVIVTLGEGRGLRVLFVQRAHDPFKGQWALPGGFVDPNETVGQAAERELKEETALSGVRLEELACFSAPCRDPRGWVVSVAHLALVTRDRMALVLAGDDAASTAWLDVTVLPGGGFRIQHDGQPVEKLAFDHHAILETAVKRLRDRVGELAFELLPPAFELSEARAAFEAILGEDLDPLVFDRVLQEGVVRAVTLPTRAGVVGGARYVRDPVRRVPWARPSDRGT